MPAIIGDLAKLPDGAVDWRFLQAVDGGIEPCVTIDDLLNLEEVRNVGQSWADAVQANIEIAQDRD